MKKIGFLSFGHWSATPHSQVRSGSDALIQSIELAEIMVSMGLAQGAADALTERIRVNPKRALYHWLKLLEVYRRYVTGATGSGSFRSARNPSAGSGSS